MPLLGEAVWLMLSASALIVGLSYASYTDLKTREVSDRLWILLAVIGWALALAALSSPDAVSLVAWLLAGALVVEHVVPWDAPLERVRSWLPGAIELTFYAVVVVSFGELAVAHGIGLSLAGGSNQLPVAAIAVVVSVFLARGLFEVGVLYGGADAKALMVAGILVPLDASPLFGAPGHAAALLPYYPFAVNVLMNAALVSVAIPLTLALANLRRGDFTVRRGFLGYWIPVRDLPKRFVWVKDPLLDAGPDEEAATTEEDNAIRTRQMNALLSRGVERVWVTPQLPFVVVLFAGAILALLWGNVVFNLAALL